MLKTPPNYAGLEARRALATIEDLEKLHPSIKNLGPARRQGIRLMLALDWRLDAVIPRTKGRNLFRWSKADGSWDGSRDVLEICQENLKPMTVMRAAGGYEYSLEKVIKEAQRDYARGVLGEEILE